MKRTFKISRIVPRRDSGKGRYPEKYPGLSWTRIGNDLGVSPEWICRIMNGHARPSMQFGIRLSSYLGITVEELNGLYRRRSK